MDEEKKEFTLEALHYDLTDDAELSLLPNLNMAKKIREEGHQVAAIFFIRKDKAVDGFMLATLDKNVWKPIMVKIVEDKQPDEYLFLCEAYRATVKNDDPMQTYVEKGMIRVGELPNRTECISFVHGTHGVERYGDIQFVRKDKDVIWSDIEWVPPKNVSGHFVHIWPAGDVS